MTMKHYFSLLAGAVLAACMTPAMAQNVDALPPISGADVDKAADYIYLRDGSVDAADGALRKMKLEDLVDVPGLFDGMGGGGGGVSPSEVSTTGGASKIPRIAADGSFRTSPINATDTNPNTPLRMAAFQRMEFEDGTGNVTGSVYNFPSHSNSSGPGFMPEIVWNSPRHCFYWDEGFQIGNSTGGGAARGRRYLYFNPLGRAKAGTSVDVTMESPAVFFSGEHWSGSAALTSRIGMQYVPTGASSGELAFAIGGDTFSGDAGANGRLRNSTGYNEIFTLTNLGPKLPTGKGLRFPDGSFQTTKGEMNAPVRSGNIGLVGGSSGAVPNASVSAFTNVMITRKTANGTIGDLTYTTNPGTGFAIASSSASDTSVVTYQLIESLVAVDAPSITGTNAVTDILTAAGGGVGAYQWYSGATAVSGEVSATYAIRAADIGKAITCQKGGVASNVVTAWKPGDEAGYYADYRADLGLFQTVGGAAAATTNPVGQWQDQSGNARHLPTTDDSYRPLVNATTYPGYPFLDFDGVDDHMKLLGTAGRPITTFVVFELKSLISNRAIFAAGPSGSRSRFQQGAGPTFENNAAATAGSTAVVGQRSIGTARTTSDTNGIRINSSAEVVSTPVTTGDGDGIYFGGTASFTPTDMRGFALLVYASDLSEAAQTRIRKYLKAKWGTI